MSIKPVVVAFPKAPSFDDFLADHVLSEEVRKMVLQLSTSKLMENGFEYKVKHVVLDYSLFTSLLGSGSKSRESTGL